jgi:SAM-dependent methyltransferase
MKRLQQIILNDYRQDDIQKFKEVKFLKEFSKSKVFVTPSGLICHIPKIDNKSSLELWDKRIFSKRINQERLQYSSNNAIMRSRHYYSAIFINSLLPNKKIRFCDFGSGEGNFIHELDKINKNIKFYFTESSKLNFNNIKKKYKKKIVGFNGSIEDSVINRKFKKLDAASLLWTLCNCINPIEVLTSIHKNLKNNGLLVVSESSRIMVPFKKPIYNFFNSKIKTENMHPWFFSYNSLSNLLEISGFKVVKINRYYDENDLVIVARKKKNFRPSLKLEDQKKVILFLMKWKKNSILLKKLTNNFC